MEIIKPSHGFPVRSPIPFCCPHGDKWAITKPDPGSSCPLTTACRPAHARISTIRLRPLFCNVRTRSRRSLRPFCLAVRGCLESGCGWRPIARVANKLDRPRLLVKPLLRQTHSGPPPDLPYRRRRGFWPVVLVCGLVRGLSPNCHRTVRSPCPLASA